MSDATPLAARVLALLPQTQCEACGQPGCGPYAAAVVAGSAALDACTPGGAMLAQALRRLLARPSAASLADFLSPLPTRMHAVIRDADCIGCTKCLAPCPTDAIVGARQQLHGILAEDCTGCGLCVPPCPVDCIEMQAGEEATLAPTPEVARELLLGARVEACTDCGACAPACPAGLAPVPLAGALRALDVDTAQALGLARCTECRACDAVCPERIPLTAHFMHGKAVVAAAAEAGRRAGHAAQRVAARERRLRRGPQAQAVTLVAPPPDRADAAAGVQAALARARARRDA